MFSLSSVPDPTGMLGITWVFVSPLSSTKTRIVVRNVFAIIVKIEPKSQGLGSIFSIRNKVVSMRICSMNAIWTLKIALPKRGQLQFRPIYCHFG